MAFGLQGINKIAISVFTPKNIKVNHQTIYFSSALIDQIVYNA